MQQHSWYKTREVSGLKHPDDSRIVAGWEASVLGSPGTPLSSLCLDDLTPPVLRHGRLSRPCRTGGKIDMFPYKYNGCDKTTFPTFAHFARDARAQALLVALGVILVHIGGSDIDYYYYSHCGNQVWQGGTSSRRLAQRNSMLVTTIETYQVGKVHFLQL